MVKYVDSKFAFVVGGDLNAHNHNWLDFTTADCHFCAVFVSATVFLK